MHVYFEVNKSVYRRKKRFKKQILLSGDNKSSYILKQIYSFYQLACLSMYELLLSPDIKSKWEGEGDAYSEPKSNNSQFYALFFLYAFCFSFE